MAKIKAGQRTEFFQEEVPRHHPATWWIWTDSAGFVARPATYPGDRRRGLCAWCGHQVAAVEGRTFNGGVFHSLCLKWRRFLGSDWQGRPGEWP